MLQKIMQAIMPANKMIDMFTFQLSTNQPIENITQKVIAECEKHKFSILQTYVYHDILQEKGFPIERKAFIYEICQAKTASLMLTDHPNFSIFMPCRLAIYENEDKTVVSTMNMGMMLDAVRSNPELYKEATTLFDTLKTLMGSLLNN